MVRVKNEMEIMMSPHLAYSICRKISFSARYMVLCIDYSIVILAKSETKIRLFMIMKSSLPLTAARALTEQVKFMFGSNRLNGSGTTLLYVPCLSQCHFILATFLLHESSARLFFYLLLLFFFIFLFSFCFIILYTIMYNLYFSNLFFFLQNW